MESFITDFANEWTIMLTKFANLVEILAHPGV